MIKPYSVGFSFLFIYYKAPKFDSVTFNKIKKVQNEEKEILYLLMGDFF